MSKLVFVFEGFTKCGLNGRMETPGPIPNPEAKHSNGDDSQKRK